MRILKIKGKDEETIYKQIEKEYGKNVVIISTHKERVAGVKGWFRKAVTTVTIAVEENQPAEENHQLKIKETTFLPQETKEESIDMVLSILKEEANRINLEKDLLNQEKDTDLQQNTYINKHSNEVSGPIKEPKRTQENTFSEMISRGLINEGISKEVVDELMQEIKSNMSIDEIARILYIKLKEMLIVDQNPDAYPYIFFIGSTGVGKTTTIAKLTAGYVLNKAKQVTLFTADTYRIAAIDQLKTYAEIIDVPVEVVYEQGDFIDSVEKWKNQDYILVDTAGRSHKNISEVQKTKELMDYIPNKKVFLVLNMSTNYKDAKNIIDVYKELIGEFSIIFTKLDETDIMGNLINIASYARQPIAYVSTGQDVPDDIERFEVDAYIKQVLGRISYE